MADAAATKYRLLLKSAVSELVGHELITIKCSSQLTAAYVLYILKQVSQTFARSCQSSIDSAIVTPKKKQPKTEQQNADMSWACTKHQHTCRVIEKTASVSAIAIEWISRLFISHIVISRASRLLCFPVLRCCPLFHVSVRSALVQHSLVVSGVRGREYRPKFNKTVLFLKNIDLCATDAYGTCEIMELAVQLIRRLGFYTETLEWISVTGLTICCSMLNIERQPFSPRFLSMVQHFYAE